MRSAVLGIAALFVVGTFSEPQGYSYSARWSSSSGAQPRQASWSYQAREPQWSGSWSSGSGSQWSGSASYGNQWGSNSGASSVGPAIEVSAQGPGMSGAVTLPAQIGSSSGDTTVNMGAGWSDTYGTLGDSQGQSVSSQNIQVSDVGEVGMGRQIPQEWLREQQPQPPISTGPVIDPPVRPEIQPPVRPWTTLPQPIGPSTGFTTLPQPIGGCGLRPPPPCPPGRSCFARPPRPSRPCGSFGVCPRPKPCPAWKQPCALRPPMPNLPCPKYVPCRSGCSNLGGCSSSCGGGRGPIIQTGGAITLPQPLY